MFNNVCLQICLLKQQGGWTEIWDNNQKVPAMYKGNQWVGFDNERSIRMKAEYAIAMNLGGAMIWSIETEDIHGFCGRSYPILSTINEAFFGSSNANPGSGSSGSVTTSKPVTTSTPKATTTTTTTTKAPIIGNDRTDCSTAGYIRDADDCNVYHYCQNYEIIHSLKCPSGLVFNDHLWACDWPYNVPEC